MLPEMRMELELEPGQGQRQRQGRDRGRSQGPGHCVEPGHIVNADKVEVEKCKQET